MNSSHLVLLWAVIGSTALVAGPRLPVSIQLWVATGLAVMAALISFIRLVYEVGRNVFFL